MCKLRCIRNPLHEEGNEYIAQERLERTLPSCRPGERPSEAHGIGRTTESRSRGTGSGTEAAPLTPVHESETAANRFAVSLRCRLDLNCHHRLKKQEVCTALRTSRQPAAKQRAMFLFCA